MALVATKSKYHVALDGQGLILQGVPERPAYLGNNAPVYGTRFASGDRDYNDLSQWWYLTQTDWSGGFKDNVSFADDAKFYYSSNIDARTKPGTFRLEHDVTEYTDWAGDGLDEILDVKTMIENGNDRTHAIFGSNVRNLNGTTASWDSDGTPSFQLAHKNLLWLFGTTTGTGSGSPYPFVMGSKSTQINGLIAGSIDTLGGVMACVVGGTLFVAGVSDVGNLWIVKTAVADPASGADWTLCAEVPIGNSLGASITGIAAFGAGIILLVEGSPVWTLSYMDVATNVVTPLQEFDTATQTGIYNRGGRYVTLYKDMALITICHNSGSDDENGEIWKLDSSLTLTRVYSTSESKNAFSTREGRGWLRGGGVVYGGFCFWGNLVFDGEHFFNFIKGIADDTDYVGIPVGTDGDRLWMVDNDSTPGEDQSILYEYDKEGTVFKDGANNSAFIVFSQHDKLQSIDKLLHSINIGFEQFAANQVVRVYYSMNQVPDPDLTTGGWTLLGTASHTLDGASATFKTFNFPVGTTAKKVWFRMELQADGTNTPTVTDFTLEYLPMPEYKKQWNINANVGDETKTLDGALPETTARELKSRLERAWWTKSQLDFQDVDYASTTITNNPLSDSATTVNVATTVDFPEQGRLKIDDEEMFYTGKTPKTFTGVTRGARGTKAVAHTVNTQIHNGYKVLVLGVETRIPVLLEGKHVEYTFGLSLREV